MFFFRQNKVFYPQIILLMGGPGSGKGVLAKNLPDLTHISIGEKLRNIASIKNNLQSEIIQNCMQNGKLLEDDIIFDLLTKAPELETNQAVLLDGFPRTLSQWNLLKTAPYRLSAIIDLQVSPHVIHERLCKRERRDDKPDIIEKRIKDYLDNTRPMANIIIAENSLIACEIKSDNLNPEEVAEIARDFLQRQNLYSLDMVGVRQSME